MYVLRDDDLIVECATDAEVLAAEQAARAAGVLVLSVTTEEPTVDVPMRLAEQVLAERRRINSSVTHEKRDATADALEAALAARKP